MLKNAVQTSLKALVIAIGSMSASTAYSSIVQFDLTGVGNTVNGYGRDGLYLGSSSWSGFSRPANNWAFETVHLEIDDTTGNGVLRGDMTYLADDSTWGIDVMLNNLFVKNAAGRQAYDASSDDLLTILSLASSGSGIEWQNLSMTVTSPSPFWGASNSHSSLWKDLAMPEIGHIGTAELYQQDNYLGSGVSGLVFDAWYQRADCANCLYQVGDTKALANLNPDTKTPKGEVPIPGTLLLFATGLLGLAYSPQTRKRRRA